LTLVLPDLENLHDVGVLQARQRLPLCAQPGELLWVGLRASPQHL
jgi:hypothetical protein